MTEQTNQPQKQETGLERRTHHLRNGLILGKNTH